MGWKKSSLAFCTVTKMIVDMDNTTLQLQLWALPHPLESQIEAAKLSAESSFCINGRDILWDPHMYQSNSKSPHYITIFVNAFLVKSQGPLELHMQGTFNLLHAKESIFLTWEEVDGPHKTSIFSKKLMAGDRIWYICNTDLVWLVDTVVITLFLQYQIMDRLIDIVGSIICNQCSISVDQWNRVLEEHLSMAMSIPIPNGPCSQIAKSI